jgi:hypothetical protein
MAIGINELNEMFSRSESALQSHFAEIRTNILLDTGFHHPKYDKGSARNSMFRDMSQSKKIRITQNHIQVVTKFIRNSIQNRAPGAGIFPKNEKELADRKSAELNDSVYEHLKQQSDLTSFYAKLIQHFVVTGECYAKVFYDPYAGDFVGYEGIEDEGDDTKDHESSELEAYPEKAKIKGDRVARFKGAIVYETIPAYRVFTDPDADSPRTCKWVCIQKFFSRHELMERYAGDKKKLEMIKKSSEQKQEWFNGFTGIYSEGSDEVEVREYYFKPCGDYPEGAYFFATDVGILESGELPDGFCIFSEVYDESPETCRGYSVVRQAKPYQVEINRAAAAAITESIVLGHSTVLYPAGEKPSTTAIGNGMKGLAYHSVNPPTVLPGVTGRNYIEYMEQKIEELYRVCGVPQIDEDKNQSGTNDAIAMLGRSLRDKMRFSLYAEKIESMIVKIVEYSLKLARRYIPDDEIIPIVGKTEAVNIPEFRNTRPQEYQIKVKPRSDDFSSTLGKSIQLQWVLQYAGSSLPPEAIAAVVRELPFLNTEGFMKDQTVFKDQADAVILSLDRGEVPFFFERTNHEYMISRLTSRMNEADFPLLPQNVQMNYLDRLSLHDQVMTQQQQEAAAATSGFIPSGGGLVSADYYITTPEGKQQRVRLPYEAVDWLVKRLSQQGTQVDKITNLPLAAQADLGKSMQQSSQGPMGMPMDPGSPQPMPQQPQLGGMLN